MLWRDVAWGWPSGSQLGTAYGAIFANARLIFDLLGQPPPHLQGGDILRVILAMLFLGFLGATVGGVFGVPTEFVVGLLNGILVGHVTRLFAIRCATYAEPIRQTAYCGEEDSHECLKSISGNG